MSDGRFGGFGRIPSVQTKTDEKDEARNVLRFFQIGFLISVAIEVVVYVALNTLFDGQDWYALFYGMVIVSGLAAYVYLSHRWGVLYQIFSDSDFSIPFSWRALFLCSAYVILVSWSVVPTMVRIFNFPEELAGDLWAMIRYTGSTVSVGLLVAVVTPGIALLSRALFEIRDPYHSPVERTVEEAKRKSALALKEKEWELSHRESEEETGRLPAYDPGLVPVYGLSGAGKKLKLPDPREQFRLCVIDFLELMMKEEVGTEQSSWKNHDMPRSGNKLVRTLGNEIRDYLMRAGFAQWDNPESRRGGWHLTQPINEILAAVQMFTGSQMYESNVYHEDKSDEEAL